MYKTVRKALFLQDAEESHMLISALGKVLGTAPARRPIAALYRLEDERLSTHVFGIDFRNPIGLAAGFDKNAELIPILASLGFGFIEIGTVTPQPQPGNPRPRLFRLPEDEAVVNRMGFNSKGAVFVREELRHIRHSRVVIGVNIGRNKSTSNEDALLDYEKCFDNLSDYADYVVINVSSPNTPNLRELQEKKPLMKLLKHVQTINFRKAYPKPILLKIGPDLSQSQLDDVIEIVRQTAVRGIIATNTSVSRSGLRTSKRVVDRAGDGGLSGQPLKRRSTEVIRYIFSKSKGKIPIIGVGGVFSAEDAYEKIRAGASLVELYTGLIYEGPGLVKKIKQGLVAFLERDGFKSVKDAIGADHQ